MNQLLLLTKNNITETMRTYSNWKKEISLYLSSYINSLESKMKKELKLKRDPYMEHQLFWRCITRSIYGTFAYDVIESNLKLNSNNLEKSTESLLRGIPLNTEYKHEVLTT